MPTATTRPADSPVKSSASGGSSSKLRPMTPSEWETWTVALRNQAFSNFEFIDLDEAHEYLFKVCGYFVIQTEDLTI